jgi:O-methyltransferase
MNSSLFRNFIKGAFAKFGYEIHLTPKPLDNAEYGVIIPSSTYSPWLKDKEFQETFEVIRDFTLVDRYRCFELWTLIEQSAKLDGGIIEVGVWRGGTGALIAKKAELCGIANPVYLCDTFKGVVKAGDDDSYSGGEHADTSRKVVEGLIFDRMKLNSVKIMEGVFPDQTSRFIEESQFRFCHVDVDVYQSAKDIVDWIWDRLVIGGIVVYDDYGFQSCRGITKYVEEQSLLKDRLIIHNLNGHAIIIKIK